MAEMYSLDQGGVKLQIRVKDCVDDAFFDTSNISSQKMIFYKPNGTSFEKTATLVEDPANPSQEITLTNIVGDGIEDTITVTVPNTALLKEGELMSISDTTNFNSTNKPITIVTSTTFTYELGTVGSTTAETSGTVTTQGEKLITYHNTSPETSIWDLTGQWEYAAELTLSTSDVAQTSQRVVAWVV